MEKARSDTVTVVQAKINLGKLDKTRFYDEALLAGLRLGLHPISVVKTRMQVATKGMVDKSTYLGVRGLLRTEGIPGLYRGFGTAMAGAIPAKVISITAFKTTWVAAYKMVEPFKLSDPTNAAISSGVAGMTASLCSKGVSVPIDVISQRLMVQGYSGHASYNGAFDVAHKVLKQDGIRGLYRGYGLCVMNHYLSGAVLNTSYFYSKLGIWSLLGHGADGSRFVPIRKIVVIAGAIFSHAAQLYILTPLDTIKTRLQVMGHEKRPSTRQVIKTLIADEGWKGFYRGFGPSCITAAVFGTSYLFAKSYFKIFEASAGKRGKDSQETVRHGNGRPR